MNEPTIGQLVLLALAILAFSGGEAASVARIWRESNGLRVAAKVAMYMGIVLSLTLLIWHSYERGNWLPVKDNFDTLLWLAVLLAVFVQYVQRHKPLGGLEWLCMPIVILLLIAAAVFGRATPHEYLPGTWNWTHRVTSFGGLLGFFIAGIAGVMYLLKTRQLRTKHATAGAVKLGSLERLEHVTYMSVTLGFALLTIGLITGLVRVLTKADHTLGERWYGSPTVVLTFAVWLVYAIVLHAPINPSFRGRKAAILSVFGLVLTLGTLLAVQYIAPGGSH